MAQNTKLVAYGREESNLFDLRKGTCVGASKVAEGDLAPLTAIFHNGQERQGWTRSRS